MKCETKKKNCSWNLFGDTAHKKNKKNKFNQNIKTETKQNVPGIYISIPHIHKSQK